MVIDLSTAKQTDLSFTAVTLFSGLPESNYR